LNIKLFTLKNNAMKKFMFLTFVCAMLFSTFKVQAQAPRPYTIPSYNIGVNGLANFQESTLGDSTYLYGKKFLRVRTTWMSSLSSCNLAVYVYSLDGLDYTGPYSVSSGQVLSVEADNRTWGVLVQAECDVQSDVWIDWVGLANDTGFGAN
jgi:hypothetical protein